MYEEHYGLRDKPFSLLPDPDFLYLSKYHRTALSMLEYGLATQAGFVVITGEVGAGKTTLVRRFLASAGEDVTMGVITNTHSAFGDLLSWIAMAFEIDHKGRDKVELYNLFIEFVLAQYAANRRTVLVVDEAQNFGTDLLEELRMLSNINNGKEQLLQLVLVGQPELLATLKQPSLRQFVQRISVHYHLEPLNAGETANYIAHRLTVAGGDAGLFAPDACAAVHYFTGGVPRLINSLCDMALVYGFTEDLKQIDFGTVVEVVNDRSRSGLSPFAPMPDAGIREFLEESKIIQQ